ncbi:MAG: hypothetical protein OIF32_03215, partial [Campylobacterales bacterium]|nr:hypothetical protein [Campylobacterales bacterium]
EVLNGGNYTYLKLKDSKKNYWIAVSKVFGVKKGDEVRFIEEMVVKDLHSKSLNKDFKNIIFGSDLRYRTSLKQSKHLALITTHTKKSKYKRKNTITIKEAISNRNSYKNKEISIRGKVVKVSKNILNRNWIHIQDGTGENKKVGRVVFTSKYVPKLGSIVTGKGIARIDKDFGSGYVYPIVVENGTFSK